MPALQQSSISAKTHPLFQMPCFAQEEMILVVLEYYNATTAMKFQDHRLQLSPAHQHYHGQIQEIVN